MTRRLLLILAVTACKDEATPLDLADVPTTIVAEGPTSVTGSVGSVGSGCRLRN